jgi:hypothetical protein
MGKLGKLLFKLLLLFSVFPLVAKVPAFPDANSEFQSGTNVQSIRIEELKAVDKSLMNVAERNQLRAELYALKRSLSSQARNDRDVVFISAALVIGIILLITLI